MDIIETRLINESIAVRLATERISSAEIVPMQDILFQFDRDTNGVETETMTLQDREFHKIPDHPAGPETERLDNLLAAAGAKKAVSRASREIKSAGSSGCHESWAREREFRTFV